VRLARRLANKRGEVDRKVREVDRLREEIRELESPREPSLIPKTTTTTTGAISSRMTARFDCPSPWRGDRL
jgi:hypothetical protein